MIIRDKYLNHREKEALEHLVNELKSALKDQIVMIRLFGSKVRGDYTSDSDMDVFLVIKDRNPKNAEKIAEINLDIDIEYNTNISLIILSEHEYLVNREFDTPFIENVLSEGVPL